MRLEEELRRALREGVSGVGTSEEAWDAIERRLEGEASGRSGRRFAVAAVALTVSAASLVGLWHAFRSAPTDRLGGEPVDLHPRVTAVVPVGPSPGDVAVGEGAVWVAVPAQPPAQDRQLIVRIDPATNDVIARIPMDDYIEELAAGEGGVWANAVAGTAANPVFSIVRIDPATNEVVATIRDVSGPLAVGEAALWAVDRAGARAGPEGSTLLRIDPGTNRVAARIPLGVALWDVEVGDSYVWVLTFEPEQGDGDILQVDPRTNEVVARIDVPVPGSVFAPALGEGAAWVPVCCVDNELNLVRVDVSSGQIVGVPIRVTQAGAPVAVAAGHVWMVAEDGALYGMNVATSEVDETVSGFDWPAGTFPDPPAELDADRLAVWVANYQDSVTRIDLAASAGGGPSSLEAEGTSLVLPEGWHGRTDPLPGYTHPIFQAATFALPLLDGIEATDARGGIGPDDVLIVLEEFTALCPSCPSESSGLPITLGNDDFEDATTVPKWLPPLTDVPPDHALARRVFNVGPRYFDLRVEFGSAPARDELVAEVNRVLATLTIGEWAPEPNGICQWNEIGMLDPDCPQTQWLRKVLTTAGFEINERGGSGAWVARSDKVQFFIWVEEADAVSNDHLALLEDADAFPVRRDVDGVTVYGNDQGWEWRAERVHVFIRQGPHGYTKLPTLEELSALVGSSLEVPYPPP